MVPGGLASSLVHLLFGVGNAPDAGNEPLSHGRLVRSGNESELGINSGYRGDGRDDSIDVALLQGRRDAGDIVVVDGQNLGAKFLLLLRSGLSDTFWSDDK